MKSNAQSYIRKCNSEIGIQESEVSNVQSVIMYSSTIWRSRILQPEFEIHYSGFGIQKSGLKNRQPEIENQKLQSTIQSITRMVLRSSARIWDLLFTIRDSIRGTVPYRYHHSNCYRFIITVVNNSLQNMLNVFWNSNMSNTTSVPWNSLNHYYLLFSQKFVYYH